VLLLACGAPLASCGGGEAGTIRRSVSQVMDGARIDSLSALTALPCAARIDENQDPDDIAPGMATSRLNAALAVRAPATKIVSQVSIEERQLSGNLATFYRNWLGHPEEGDGKELKRVALRLQAGVLLVAGVLKWKQTDDYTRVGMVAGLFDGATGKMLWWSEQERQANSSPGDGAPPDYLTVVDSVIVALLEELPGSGTP